MTWAKHHPPHEYDLTGSNLLPCTLDELPGARETLEIYGRNDEGWPPLVDAIADRYGVPSECVVTAPGASGANFLALAALLRPGDSMLAEHPGYDPHAGAAHLLGAHVSHFDRGWERRFELDPSAVAALVTPETRAIVLTNLHNPSGAYAQPEALAEVGRIAREIGACVVVDEVYLDALRGIDAAPAATRDDVFVSTNSLTKSYGLSGLRVGWIIAEPEVAERARRVRDVVDGVGSIPSETLGVLAFRHLEMLLDRARAILEPGAEIFARFVARRDELEWVRPVGGAVGFPRLVGTHDAEPFVEFAAREFGVGVTPGRFFGDPAHFRVAVAGERDVLEGGLVALGRALDAWQP
jgi:aspartate/methionine/tyrosine aminotransferase